MNPHLSSLVSRLSALLVGASSLIAPAALGADAPPAEAAPAGMVRVPGGFFRMGERTGPTHDVVAYVKVSPFLLDATEVTVAAFGECVKAGRCKPAAATVEWEGLRAPDRTSWSRYCNQDRADRADHPVNCVDWGQAAAYCAWAGKRLPSEEEWEWAARNGKQGTTYPWGNDPPASQLCWNGEGNDAGRGNRAGTCAAGSHPAGDSRAGVKDLAGNVWEWTSSQSVAGADSRGRGGTPVKVARGGGWTDVDPRSVTATIRLEDVPSRRSGDLGFRCAKSP